MELLGSLTLCLEMQDIIAPLEIIHICIYIDVHIKSDITILYMRHIIETSQEHNGVLNHWQPDCLFNSALMVVPKKPSQLHITGPLGVECVSNAENVSMSWCYNYIVLVVWTAQRWCHPPTCLLNLSTPPLEIRQSSWWSPHLRLTAFHISTHSNVVSLIAFGVSTNDTVLWWALHFLFCRGCSYGHRAQCGQNEVIHYVSPQYSHNIIWWLQANFQQLQHINNMVATALC